MARSILHTRVRHLLDERPRRLTYEVLAEMTGLQYHWIERFAQDRIKEPTALKMEKLYAALNGAELDVD